jgi:hypothetical protein
MMIEGSTGEEKTVNLRDTEIGALLKALDVCETECNCRLNEKLDEDDRYALGAAVTKLQMVC